MYLRVAQKELKFDNFKGSEPMPKASAEILININNDKYETHIYKTHKHVII